MHRMSARGPVTGSRYLSVKHLTGVNGRCMNVLFEKTDDHQLTSFFSSIADRQVVTSRRPLSVKGPNAQWNAPQSVKTVACSADDAVRRLGETSMSKYDICRGTIKL